MNFSRLLPILASLFFSATSLSAQIVDNFSDGNFDQNPSWVGDIAHFKVSAAFELQLNAVSAGQSALLVEGNIPDSAIWEFDVRLGFDPSTQNLVRVFLLLNNQNISSANGYLIEMGETGSADAIRFFRQDGGSKTLLATGQAGLAANSPNLHIRAVRSAQGDWAVEAAPVGSALMPQFSVSDDTWPSGSNHLFGFQCVYTISNVGKFFFDNINIQPNVPDTQPPVLLSAIGNNTTQVTAQFNEDLELSTAENPANYLISNGIGTPSAAMLAPDKRSVVLSLQNPLVTGNYTLQTTNVADALGNISGSQTVDFQFVKLETATTFDIVISEIMANPSPSVGLPEVEWIELCNRSNKLINLATLRLNDAVGAPVPLPSYVLMPGRYVAVAAIANAPVLQAAAADTVLGVAVSSTILNNDGDMLTLSDAAGNVVDFVPYSVDWHTDAGAKNGGRSLERKNLDLPCLGSVNWQSCPATIGGTPAAPNASNTLGTDQDPPVLFRAYLQSANTILLTFSEGMDEASAEDVNNYLLEPFIGVVSAELSSSDRAQVLLTLENPLATSTVYTLQIESSVQDCSGNAYYFTESVLIGVPEKPAVQDIVINEILYNPLSGGARYIEFYNRSQKVFDWSEFFLASNYDMSSSVVAISQDRLFFPGDFHVFSSNAPETRTRFANIVQKNVMQNLLPSLDDNTDSIKIYWAKGGQSVTVDSFFYYRNLHNNLLSTSEQEGVALERIRTDGPTQMASNWTSASSIVTGAPGTPTLPNSQSLQAGSPFDELISIPVARLSPDGDAREDFLEIFYKLPGEGYVASLSIFDSDGNLVKNLVRQQLAGIQGAVRWDGDTHDGSKARPGIHIIYVELFSPNGEVHRVKKTVALVGKF